MKYFTIEIVYTTGGTYTTAVHGIVVATEALRLVTKTEDTTISQKFLIEEIKEINIKIPQ